MNEAEVFAKLNKVFQKVFDDKSIRVTRATTAKDIEDWDSMEHITLIGAVEKEFGMRFKMKEVSSMKNVGEMADIIMSRV